MEQQVRDMEPILARKAEEVSIIYIFFLLYILFHICLYQIVYIIIFRVMP